MVDPHKLFTDASVDTLRKYLIFIIIPANLLPWVCEIRVLCTSLLNKLEVFLPWSIQCILGITMYTVKEKVVTNETVRNRFFDIPNIEHQIAIRQLTFIDKVVRNYDAQLPTKLLAAWCNHKRRREGVLHKNKNSIFCNIRLVMPEVGKMERSTHGRTLPLMTNTDNIWYPAS